VTRRRDTFITSPPGNAESQRDRRSRASCWPAAAILVLSVFINTAAISEARADDDDDAAPAVAERKFVLSEQQFDQMMFGGQLVQVDNAGR